MTARLERVREDIRDEAEAREKLESRFVTMEHFKAVVEPIQRELRDLGRDIKKILRIVSRLGHEGSDE